MSAVEDAERWVREQGGWMLDDGEREAELERRGVHPRSRPRLHRLAGELEQAELRAGVSPNGDQGAEPTARSRLVDGATFVFAEPEQVPAVWGRPEDGEVAWAAGEPLMIVAPQGTGKTTTAQRLALARIGLGDGRLLGMPVARDARPVLYVAADRPRQAARSMRRMVTEADRDQLARLVVWPGPLPFSVTGEKADPRRLAAFCQEQDVGTLFIDSIKDIAVDLSRDETGSRVNAAVQEVIAADIEVCLLHHQRKQQQGASAPKSLSDVYGSTWLTAGCGSVLLLWGEPGDTLVELKHLKQPVEAIGPLQVFHDHERGQPHLHEPVDLLHLLQRAGATGLEVVTAATALFGDTPTRNETERTRRRLEKLRKNGHALHVPSLNPGDAGRYVYNGGGGA